MIPHFGFRPADENVITTLQREAEMRSIRLAVHAAKLEKERARLAREREAAAERAIAERMARSRKRRRVAETVMLTVVGVALLIAVAIGAGPFGRMGR